MIVFLLKKKSQSSIEFTLIVGVMIFVLIGMFSVIQGRSASIMRTRQNQMMEEIGNILRIEVRLAEDANGYYSREFILPSVVNNYNYSISLNLPAEFSIKLEGSEYVVFLNSNVTGSICKGKNLIKSENGNISISSIDCY